MLSVADRYSQVTLAERRLELMGRKQEDWLAELPGLMRDILQDVDQTEEDRRLAIATLCKRHLDVCTDESGYSMEAAFDLWNNTMAGVVKRLGMARN
jgi:hypothetical protein